MFSPNGRKFSRKKLESALSYSGSTRAIFYLGPIVSGRDRRQDGQTDGRNYFLSRMLSKDALISLLSISVLHAIFN